MPNYFYTDNNGQKQGPFDDRQLKDLATRGIITPNTPLETEESHTGLAGMIPGLFVVAPSPFQLPEPSPFSQPFQGIPQPERIDPAKTIQMVNTNFIVFVITAIVGLGAWWLTLRMTPGDMFEAIEAMDQPTLLIYCLLSLAGLLSGSVSLVSMCMLLYQLWKRIPAPTARTSPGKAVGFLFIPLFNIYWVFIAFWGLGIDMNKTLRFHGIQYSVDEGHGLKMSVFACIYLCYILIPFELIPGAETYIPLILTGLILIYAFRLFRSVKDGAILLPEQES